MCGLLNELDLLEFSISDLSQSLPFPARRAFREAAIAAVAALPERGAGAIYRCLRPLQASHFDPPSDERASFDIAQRPRTSKLMAEPAIEHARLGPRGRPMR